MFVKLTKEDDKKFFVNSEAILIIKPAEETSGSTLILKGYESGVNVKETPGKVAEYLRSLR